MKKILKKILNKKILTIFLVIIISGCIGEKNNIANDNIVKDVDNMKNMSVSAENFKEGEYIPNEYTCDGEDISPALTWSGVPEGTISLVLIMEDPDAPGGTFVHWILFNIPVTTQNLPRGIEKTRTLRDFSRQGMTDFGDIGYGGPCPPKGKPHRYYFRLYALDKMLELLPGASKNQIDTAIKGHILGTGELMGLYYR